MSTFGMTWFSIDRFTYKCSLVNWSLVRHADQPTPKMLNFFSCGSTAFSHLAILVSWLSPGWKYTVFLRLFVIYLVTSALAAYTSGVFKPNVYDLNNSSSWNTKFVKHLSYAAKVCFKGREARTSLVISAPLCSTTWIRKTSRFFMAVSAEHRTYDNTLHNNLYYIWCKN